MAQAYIFIAYFGAWFAVPVWNIVNKCDRKNGAKGVVKWLQRRQQLAENLNKNKNESDNNGAVLMWPLNNSNKDNGYTHIHTGTHTKPPTSALVAEL